MIPPGGIKFIIELFVAEFLFAAFLPKRKYFWLRYALCAGIAVFIVVVLPTAKNSVLFCFELIFFFLLTCATQVICYKTSVWNYIFIGTAGYASQHLEQQPKNIIFRLTKDSVVASGTISASGYELILVVACCTICFTLIWFLFARRLKNITLNTKDKRILILSAFVLFIWVFLSQMINPDDKMEYVAFKTLLFTSCILFLFLLSSIVREKSIEEELLIIRHMQALDKERYKISRETIEQINVKCHDLKYYLAEGKLKVTDDGVDKEIEDAVSVYDMVVRTGNGALDTVLTEKSLYCRKKSIVFSCIVNGDSMSFIKDSDVYSLFGNAIDNAIEAVIDLPDPEERRIGLQVQVKGNFIVIAMQNKFKHKFDPKGDLPSTTKRDKTLHGFGMKSMKMIVEKYEGSLTFNVSGNVFNLTILIPIPSDRNTDKNRKE